MLSDLFRYLFSPCLEKLRLCPRAVYPIRSAVRLTNQKPHSAFMAFGAYASIFTTEDRPPVMRSAIVATETAASASLALGNMIFYADLARRGQRLIVISFNGMASVALLFSDISDVCTMSKRCSEGSTP